MSLKPLKMHLLNHFSTIVVYVFLIFTFSTSSNAISASKLSCTPLGPSTDCNRLNKHLSTCRNDIEILTRELKHVDDAEWDAVKGQMQDLNEVVQALRHNEEIFDAKCGESTKKHADRIEQVAEKLMKRILKKHKKDMLDIERVHSIIDYANYVVRRVKKRLMDRVYNTMLLGLVALAAFIFIGPMKMLLIFGTWIFVHVNYDVSMVTFASALGALVFLAGLLRKVM